MPLLPLPLPPLPPPSSPPTPPPLPPASEAAAKADAAIGRHSRVWDALVLSSLGLPPRLCRAAGGTCRRQLPFPASSAARNASRTSELVSQRSRCNSAWHNWQHTHGPPKFSTPVFSADNTSAFVKNIAISFAIRFYVQRNWRGSVVVCAGLACSNWQVWTVNHFGFIT
jgi:hypothetical protein